MATISNTLFNLTPESTVCDCVCPVLPDPVIMLVAGLVIGVWLGLSIAILIRHHNSKKAEEDQQQ